MRLANKVALITGATGGMGSATARLFAKEGAAVVVAARKADLGQSLVQEITAAGGTGLYIPLEVTEQAQWDEAVKKVKETFGGLHVLMNIVGTNQISLLPNIQVEEWNKVFEINVTSILMGIQACAPLMKASGGGSIVNIGSVAGITGNFATAYSSSKWALEGLSRSAAYTLADWGIRCNMIQPGFIESNMTKALASNPIAKNGIKNSVLLRRIGKADEIAYTALFLASDESSYITGTDIVVDGGWFSAGPYLTNERSNHMLELLQKKEGVEKFLSRFR